MSDKTKIIVYSLIAILIFTSFFYFYKAEIFEADITGGGVTLAVDVSLKGLLNFSDLPNSINITNVTAVKPTVKGILLLIICLVGMPIMLGYRFATNQPKKEKE